MPAGHQANSKLKWSLTKVSDTRSSHLNNCSKHSCFANVLIVDKNEEISGIILRTLAQRGIRGIVTSDFKEVIEYIAKASPYYAGITAEKILSSIERLEDSPGIGIIVPEYNNPNIREIIYKML